MNMSKMSMGKIVGLAGGLFVLLMVVTVLLLKMQESGDAQKKVTHKPKQQPMEQVPVEQAPPTEPDAFGQALFEDAAKAENEATKAQLDLLYKSSQADMKALAEDVGYLQQRVLMLDKQLAAIKQTNGVRSPRAGAAESASAGSPDALAAAARRAGYDVIAVVGQRIWVRQGEGTDTIEMSLQQLLAMPAIAPKG